MTSLPNLPPVKIVPFNRLAPDSYVWVLKATRKSSGRTVVVYTFKQLAVKREKKIQIQTEVT